MMPLRPGSPLDLDCRGCGRKSGEKCAVVPDRSLLRRRIRAGAPVTSYYIKLLPYFHAMRERDFAKACESWARLDAWEKHLAGKTA